eukprot:gene27001-3441_t
MAEIAPDILPGQSTQFSIRLRPTSVSVDRSGFTVAEARLVKQELANLQLSGLVLADDLHMAYFLTP